jgi:hypothetical protein
MLAQINALLRAQMLGETRTGFDLIDAYIDRNSKAHFANFRETQVGAPRSFATLQGFLARGYWLVSRQRVKLRQARVSTKSKTGSAGRP